MGNARWDAREANADPLAQRFEEEAQEAVGDGSPGGDGTDEAAWSRFFKKMLAALVAECRAMKETSTTLGRGERCEVHGNGVRYTFSTALQIDASVGDQIVVRVDGHQAGGVLDACDAHSITVTLMADMGSSVEPGAELLLDSPWLIERLLQRLEQVFSVADRTEGIFNLTNAFRVLGLGAIPVWKNGPTPSYEDALHPLNEEQASAVRLALRSPISVIVAPAGTGKTRTLGALVEACYRRGFRVLVTAPSNVAVDLLMAQVCHRLHNDGDFAQAVVLRLGAAVGKAFRDAYGDWVVLEDVLARLYPQLQQTVRHWARRVDECVAQSSASHRTAGRAAHAVLTRSQLLDAKRELRAEGRRLTRKARVVGATLTRAFLDPDLHGFDVVVVDEASMAQSPALFLAAGLAKRHVVIAGDPLQLAAPVRTKGPHRRWLATDVFQHLHIVDALQREEDVPYVTQLVEQYRCAPALCRLQEAVWPGLMRRTAAIVLRREEARHTTLFRGNALCFLDTAKWQPSCHRPFGRTLANETHARFVARLLAVLDNANEIPRSGTSDDAVLVLAHYRGQVAAIRALLGDRYHGRGVSVRTVHRAQGSEATTCIFDLTMSDSTEPIVSSVLAAERAQDDGARLLAVACSRARSRLIVVGNFGWLRRNAARHGPLAALCDYLQAEAYRI